MTNPHGTPIWYELVTPDPDASKTFYDAVVGWTVEAQPSGELDYRMIDTGDGQVGGVMRLSPEMQAGGARPGWLFYIGVDDVDASAKTIEAKGGRIVMAPFDLAGVGRMAFVADPQGAPFYIMRGLSDESSTAFDRTGMGKCNWNELWTSDQDAAHEFYADVFGWTYPDRLAMPGMGDYVFVSVGDATIGATMTSPPGGPPPAWRFYFRAPDIHAAAATAREHGATIQMEPMEVPGGDWVFAGTDPHGVAFGVAAPNPKEA